MQEYRLKNLDKLKKQSKEYRRNNKELIKKRQKKYYDNNKEQIKKYTDKYIQKNRKKVNLRQRKWHHLNKEKYKNSQRKYNQKNREKINEKARLYRKNNKQKVNAKDRERYYKDDRRKIANKKFGNKPENKKKRKEKYRLDKQIVIDYYSKGDSKCACCGVDGLEFLSIDHINNDGYKHRKEQGIGHKFYKWLVRNDYPQGFQVLCLNCNIAKSKNNGMCPHKTKNQPR